MEQARGEIGRLDARSDVYALGAILLELLGGPAPHQQGAPFAAAALEGAGLPPELVDICRRALAVEMGGRFADAGALARALGGWLDGVQRRARALAMVEEARAAEAEADALRSQARARWDEADAALSADGVGSTAGWAAWEEARRLRRAAEPRALDAERVLQGALAHDPDLPEAHRALARRLRGVRDRAARRGDLAAAERVARQLSTHLKWLPPEERRALAAPAKGALETRRVSRGALIGRRRLREAIAGHLERGERLLTLVGCAGVGKTRLALEAAAGWPRGAALCDLTEARSRAEILRLVGEGLGVPLTSRDAETQLGHALRARGSLLLVLDNLEHLSADAGALIARWTGMAPDLRVLGTSRSRLRAEGEVAVEVGPLSLLEAIELFAQRGRRANPDGFRLRPEQRARVGALVERLDRLPLGIELAAARLSVLPLDEISRRLAERFRLLRGRLRDPGRRALAGALGWSWDLLSPAAQATLAQVSVFRGGFELAAAEAVVDLSAHPGRPGAPAPEVLDLLEALVEDHLLTREPGEDGARYGLFESIRAFAGEKLSADAGADAVARHAAHFGAMGQEDAIEALSRRGGLWHRRRLHRSLDNLVAGAQRAEGDPAGECCLAAMAALGFLGPLAAGADLAAQLLSRGALSPSIRRRLLHQRGYLLRIAGETKRAGAPLEAALAMSRAAGDRSAEGRVLGSLGALHASLGQLGAARRHMEAALAALREGDDPTGDRRHEGIVLDNLGTLHKEQGRMDVALPLFGEALAIYRAVGDWRSEGRALNNLGNLHSRQGRRGAAREHFEAALTVYREVAADRVRDRRGEGQVLANLGYLHKEQGRLDTARGHFEAALTLAREIGSRWGEGSAMVKLGALHHMQGRRRLAREQYEGALAVYREIGNRRGEAMMLSNLGLLQMQRGQMAPAERLFEAALAVHREMGRRRSESLVLNNLGLLHLEQGRLDTAADLLEAALEINRETGDRPGEGHTLLYLGLLDAKRGRMEAAREQFEAARPVLHEVGDRRTEGVALGHLGEALSALGEEASAASASARGEALLRELNARAALCDLLIGRGRAALRAGARGEAVAASESARDMADALSLDPASPTRQALAELRGALASGDT